MIENTDYDKMKKIVAGTLKVGDKIKGIVINSPDFELWYTVVKVINNKAYVLSDFVDCNKREKRVFNASYDGKFAIDLNAVTWLKMEWTVWTVEAEN